jgi:hypothetical protein
MLGAAGSPNAANVSLGVPVGLPEMAVMYVSVRGRSANHARDAFGLGKCFSCRCRVRALLNKRFGKSA